jgi:hypothetical protein
MTANGVPTDRDQVRAAASEVREYARQALGEVDHSDVGREAGLVQDDDLRDLLGFAQRAYERQAGLDDPSFWETEWADRRLQRAATKTVGEALENQNLSQLEYLTGMPEYRSDVGGLHAASELINWLVHSEQCKLIYIAALMGRGKTDLSLTFLQTIYWHYERMRESLGLLTGGSSSDVPTPEFAANFRVDPAADCEVQQINNFDDLNDWADRGDSSDVRWFIFDEASTELTAQSGSNAQDVAELMAPFVKKMRKKGINMIVIGHDKRDVHPAIRSMADFVEKPSVKTARIYSGIKQREPVGHKMDIHNIPKTGWDFNTNDMADWSWGTALEDGLDKEANTIDDITDTEEFREWRDRQMQTIYKELDEITYADLEQIFDVSAGTVSNALN